MFVRYFPVQIPSTAFLEWQRVQSILFGDHLREIDLKNKTALGQFRLTNLIFGNEVCVYHVRLFPFGVFPSISQAI